MAETVFETPIGDITIEHPEDADPNEVALAAELKYDERQARRAELEETFKEEYKGGAASDSGLENFAAGVGKSIVDTGKGIKQAGLEALNFATGGKFQDQVDAMRSQVSETQRLDSDLMNTGSGLAGNITGYVGQALIPGAVGGRVALAGAKAAQAAGRGNLAANLARASGAMRSFSAPATYGAAAASGAIQGGLQPVGEDQSRAFNVATGGVAGGAGQALARGAGAVARGAGGAIDNATDRAASFLRQHGIDLDVAQQTGKEGLQRLRSALFDNPFTTTKQQRFAQRQLSQFTRAALKTIGVNSDEASDDVLIRASQKIGNDIDNFIKKQPVLADDVLMQELDDFAKQMSRRTDADGVRILQKNIDDIVNSIIPVQGTTARGVINPKQLITTRSNLSAARKNIGDAAAELEDILLDALDRQSPGARSGLKKALAAWRNFRLIEGAISPDVSRTISPRALSQAFRNIRNRAVGLRGLGHPDTVKLRDLAQAGRELLPETLGNSGTWGRAIAGEALLAGGGFAGGIASGQDIGGAAAIAGGAAALPLLLQRGMLSQGILGQSVASGAPGMGLLGSTPARSLINQAVIGVNNSQR